MTSPSHRIAITDRRSRPSWLAGGRYWGRPVDLTVAPDGALFLSDDGLGAVYRITYRGG